MGPRLSASPFGRDAGRQQGPREPKPGQRAWAVGRIDRVSATAAELRAAGVSGWLADRVDELARGTVEELDSYLVAVGGEHQLQDTLASCRCHLLTRDGNDRPGTAALAERLAAACVDYCIPRSRVDEAMAYFKSTRKTDKIVRLNTEARELFTALEKSGEGGEMLLYLLLESVLGLPQLLCKMPLKTSSQMHYHGADGIHGKVLGDGTLELYWGESKLYADAPSAAKACFESLAPLLLDEGGGPASRDLALIRDNLDLGDPALTEALRVYFTADNAEARRVRVCGAGLIGFSLENYPAASEGTTVAEEVAELIERWQKSARGHVLAQKLERFQLELFFVPFPDVQAFRDALHEALGTVR